MTDELADITCTECGREPHPGEVWRLVFTDVGEVAIYCPECAEREFGTAASAVALQWKHVDWTRRRLLIRRRCYRSKFAAPKSKYGHRDIPLSSRLAAELELRWLLVDDVEALVFPSSKGTPIDGDNLRRRVLTPAARRAGVPWATGFHVLRHTCASRLFRRGVNVKVVQHWLGHHSPAFTLATYIHLIPDDDLPDADLLDAAVSGNGVATSTTENGLNGGTAEGAETGMASRSSSPALEVQTSF